MKNVFFVFDATIFSLNVEVPSKESTSLCKVTRKIPHARSQCCHVKTRHVIFGIGTLVGVLWGWGEGNFLTVNSSPQIVCGK